MNRSQTSIHSCAGGRNRDSARRQAGRAEPSTWDAEISGLLPATPRRSFDVGHEPFGAVRPALLNHCGTLLMTNVSIARDEGHGHASALVPSCPR